MTASSQSPTLTPLRRWFWVLLVLIALAEWVAAAVDARAGLGLHLGILINLVGYASFVHTPAERQLALALTLAPLIRLLSLAMPLPLLPQLAWYPAVSIPLMISAWLIIRQTGLRPADLALRRGKPLLDLCIVLSGLAFGMVEYFILKPSQSLVPASGAAIALAAVVLTIFTGLSEELIFRGVLQTLGLRVLGPAGLLYVSLLFGVLHTGYLSLPDLAFVTVVGLIFALAVYRGASLLAVTASHGLINVSLFVIAPLYAAGELPGWVEPLTVGSQIVGGLGLLGLLILLGSAALRGRRTRPEEDLALARPAGAD